MRIAKIVLIMPILALLLAGCASHVAKHPGLISVTPKTMPGQMRQVALEVNDARNVSDASAQVTAMTKGIDLVDWYRPQIADVLRAYNFVPVPYQASLSRKLSFHITSIQYHQFKDGFVHRAQVQASLEVDAINGMLTYSRHYSAGIPVSGSSFGNKDKQRQAALKRVFTQLFTKALTDSKLIDFLSTHQKQTT